MLEWHYSKAEILETYINEIYLGQQGNRAIHGFGLASQFYFGRPLPELRLPEVALLVGMIKGPSFFNPRRHPQRALERRNLVLSEMARQDFITAQELDIASRAPIGVTAQPLAQGGGLRAFLDLVHRQLRRDYLEEDLRSEGLKVFTTLDLEAQAAAERTVAAVLPQLERDRRLPQHSLEVAVVITNTTDGEVLAVVGGRDSRVAGFNHALDAQRPVGSLVKPAVYLTALERPADYTLVTQLDDSPLTYRAAGAPDWSPQNYDKRFHGKVMLRDALAHSYNVATARLGLELGMDAVRDTLRRLGIERKLPPYPSTVLGAISLTPLQVAQMYHTIAGGGFHTPLKTVRAVLNDAGEPLNRYGLELQQVVEPAPVYLITAAMQDVVREGTARGLAAVLPAGLEVAGKTGTTDEFRDSWFAGFSGDRLAVTWIGRDDNQSTGLSGAAGAMRLWGAMMKDIASRPLSPPLPPDVVMVAVDPVTGLRADAGCSAREELPFIRGSEPVASAPCAGSGDGSGQPSGWFRRLFKRFQ
jgi:penicillin-binding protein 1B